MTYLSHHQRLRALLSEEMDSRSQFPTLIPAALQGGLHPREAGMYLEFLKGEEALRLGPLHPEGCLTSPFFLNSLGLA